MRGGALADLTRRDLILLVNLSEGDLWLAHVDLAGAGMSHIDLAGADLRKANLSGGDLSHADLDRKSTRLNSSH